jgi:hypothetical protein
VSGTISANFPSSVLCSLHVFARIVTSTCWLNSIPAMYPGLITLAGMEIELSEKLGRKVDLRTAEDLSHYFRAAVVSSALPQYERP